MFVPGALAYPKMENTKAGLDRKNLFFTSYTRSKEGDSWSALKSKHNMNNFSRFPVRLWRYLGLPL